MADASPSFLSSASTTWKAALDLYYEDKVVSALELVEANAAAFGGAALRTYRLIEGEARTRSTSNRIHLAPWLEFEWTPSEVPHHGAVGEVILAAATAAGDRLQWDRHEATLATVLVAEADADWHEARYGYCTDKVPYDKICLPHVSVLDPHELWRVTAHEFAHVVVLNTAQGRAPHWLDEGIACLVEGRSASGARRRLRERGIWSTPDHMSMAFSPDRRDAHNMAGVSAAYDQATVLAGFLHSVSGDPGLVDVLRAFTDHSRWTDLVSVLASREPVEVALQQVYGYGEQELFKRAEAWSG